MNVYKAKIEVEIHAKNLDSANKKLDELYFRIQRPGVHMPHIEMVGEKQ